MNKAQPPGLSPDTFSTHTVHTARLTRCSAHSPRLDDSENVLRLPFFPARSLRGNPGQHFRSLTREAFFLPHTWRRYLSRACLAATLGLVILSLSGCATTQTPIPIKIPVPVACVKVADLPKSPEMQPDSDLAKLPDGQLVLAIAAERLDLKRYHGEASALLLACAE